MKDLKKYINSVKNKEKELIKKISIKDREISDIIHYIELTKPITQNELFEAYQRLRVRLEEVRKIKNELYLLQPTIKFVDNIDLKILKKAISDRRKNIKNRRYKVKELNRIFGNYIGRGSR